MASSFCRPLEEGLCEPILLTAPTSIGRCCDLYRSARRPI
ncbi:hypothetical protein HMPREF3185_00557 [Porphyromonas somerae]|uniref:Uncharacterized protein n=1 Tax=Porphyromonas somerae TaxID=322095 RepID=A0A134BB59_9PORP|nr:hypothetical protein HMPREF3184_00557 [Porphyromonadaceae bacterium KA00676]KXB77182.1 hypothetical protein HMPREF3185_00557 [Porphyromonas somerae]